jgi:hypothetical protein
MCNSLILYEIYQRSRNVHVDISSTYEICTGQIKMKKVVMTALDRTPDLEKVICWRQWVIIKICQLLPKLASGFLKKDTKLNVFY